MTNVSRRGFAVAARVSVGASVGATGAAILAAPAIAQGKKELRTLMSWPKNFPGLDTSAERFAQRVKTLSDGTIEVKVFGAVEIVPPFEVLDGADEIAHDTSYD